MRILDKGYVSSVFARGRAICALGVILLAATVPSHAEQLRIIVPFAAGGAVDKIARVIADKLPPELGAIVENRDGAGGDIGVNAAQQAASDGKTVLLHTSSFIINSAYRKGEANTVLENFRALAKIGGVKFVLVVRKDLPVSNLEELVAYSKSGQPLDYGSTGNGTTLQVAGEMLKKATGLTATHIPYRGLAPAFNDLVAGNIDFMVTSVSGVLPFVREGEMKALAVFDAERAEELPDVPTTAEAGYEDLKISNWYGLFVQAAVPEQVRRELEQAFITTIRSPEVQAQLTSDAVRGNMGGDEFQQELESEATDLPALLKSLNISASN